MYLMYMYFKSLTSITWVYCISYHVNQEPDLVYCNFQQVYCICHHVHQEPHLVYCIMPTGVQHIPSSNIRRNTGGVLHQPSIALQKARCTSGASHQSLVCTAFAIKCTQRPWCVCTSGASLQSLGCTAFAIVYCRGHDVHVLQEPHLNHLGALHILSCKSGASLQSLGCTAFTIKHSAEAMMYFRSLTSVTWVYCICHDVYVLQEHHYIH